MHLHDLQGTSGRRDALRRGRKRNARWPAGARERGGGRGRCTLAEDLQEQVGRKGSRVQGTRGNPDREHAPRMSQTLGVLPALRVVTRRPSKCNRIPATQLPSFDPGPKTVRSELRQRRGEEECNARALTCALTSFASSAAFSRCMMRSYLDMLGFSITFCREGKKRSRKQSEGDDTTSWRASTSALPCTSTEAPEGVYPAAAGQ